MSLAYRIHRSGQSGRVLALLHGLASNMTRWSEFLAHTRLTQTWDILRFDLRGHGRSAYRGTIGMEVWCQDIAEVFDHEGYERAVVIGHSMGALVALWFACLYPQRVRGLVLVEASFPEAMRGNIRLLRGLRATISSLSLLARGANALGLRRRSLPYRDLEALDREARQALASGKREEMIAQYSSIWLDLKYIPTANYLQDLVQVLRPLPPLTAVAAPVLALLSAAPEFTDRDATDRMLAQLPRHESVTLPATHWIMTETPEKARLTIEHWCDRLADEVRPSD